MQLDYSCFCDILKCVETNSNGFNEESHTFDLSNENEVKKAYHFKILIDEGFLDATYHTRGAPHVGGAPGNLIVGIFGIEYVDVKIRGLCFSGHQFLEVMENQTVWNKIKVTVQGMGVAGVKQIPAIAIQLLKDSMV